MNESERKIAELINAEKGNVTAKEIAEKLNYSVSAVYKAVKKNNLVILKTRIKIYGKKLAPCKNRPFCCFDCKYDDCICNAKTTDEEARFCQMT